MRKEKEKDFRKGEEEDWKGSRGRWKEVLGIRRKTEKGGGGGARKEEHWNFLAKENIAKEKFSEKAL